MARSAGAGNGNRNVMAASWPKQWRREESGAVKSGVNGVESGNGVVSLMAGSGVAMAAAMASASTKGMA